MSWLFGKRRKLAALEREVAALRERVGELEAVVRGVLLGDVTPGLASGAEAAAEMGRETSEGYRETAPRVAKVRPARPARPTPPAPLRVPVNITRCGMCSNLHCSGCLGPMGGGFV